MEIPKEKVVIIGGGVAGSTVALYLARGGYKPVLITNAEIGGKLNDIELIQNYIGQFDIEGYKIAQNIQKQLAQAGMEYPNLLEYSTVTGVEKLPSRKWLVTYSNIWGDELKIETENLVIATGMKHKTLAQLPKEYQKNCVLCDGFLYKDKDVLVVGGGNSAVTEAIELAKIAKTVYILRRRTEYRAEKVLVDRMKSLENVVELVGEISDGVHEMNKYSLKCTNKQSKSEYELTVDGIFVYIGVEGNSDFNHIFRTSDEGYIFSDSKFKAHSDFNLQNVFVVGDINDGNDKQFGVAIGEGTRVGVQLLKKFSNP